MSKASKGLTDAAFESSELLRLINAHVGIIPKWRVYRISDTAIIV